MVNRMKPILEKIISPNQSAFVPGRLIQDNIVVAHEVFHYLRGKKRGCQKDMALKIYFNKAYDRIEWDFLVATMKNMGFNNSWVKFIYQCIRSVVFRVLINREPSEPFFPNRGLHQGDPLSPYLFLIVQVVLSFNLSNGIVKGI